MIDVVNATHGIPTGEGTGAKLAIAILIRVTKFVVVMAVGANTPIPPFVILFATIRANVRNFMVHGFSFLSSASRRFSFSILLSKAESTSCRRASSIFSLS